MTDERLVTLFDIPIEEMSKADAETELRLQKYHRGILRTELGVLKKKEDSAVYSSRIRLDKIDFLENYLKVMDGFIAQLEDYAYVRTDGTKEGKQKAEAYRLRRSGQKSYAIKEASLNADGVQLSWDKEKFMLVARDRGYLTEMSIVYAIENELGVPRPKAKVLLDKGKFTWGQVMCLGAMLQMTPKEFCDVFLSGYFVDYYGQFIASYDNIDKSLLLKRATTLNKKELEEIDADIE